MKQNSLLEISISDSITKTPYVEGADGLVLRWVQAGHGRGPLQQLVSNWIIDTIITVLYVLVGKWVIRICGLLMPVTREMFINNILKGFTDIHENRFSSLFVMVNSCIGLNNATNLSFNIYF